MKSSQMDKKMNTMYFSTILSRTSFTGYNTENLQKSFSQNQRSILCKTIHFTEYASK